jgi:phosphonate transport system permease protein
VPRLYGQFLAFMLYRWEIIVRESAIFGILGVATLGFYVDAAISELRFDVAVGAHPRRRAACPPPSTALSRRLRRALRIDAPARPPLGRESAPAVAGAA